MQVIIRVDLRVEEYVEQEFHRRVRAPQRCGNCGGLARLKVLGYYSRYTTGALGNAVPFWVARVHLQGMRTDDQLPTVICAALPLGSQRDDRGVRGGR